MKTELVGAGGGMCATVSGKILVAPEPTPDRHLRGNGSSHTTGKAGQTPRLRPAQVEGPTEAQGVLATQLWDLIEHHVRVNWHNDCG